MNRIRETLAGCQFVTVADLNTTAPRKLTAYLDGRTKLARKDGGLSQQTATYFLAAMRQFVWWLSARANAPVRPGLLDDVPGFDPASDRKHARRDITPEELAKILTAARAGERVRGLTGEDRYHLYLVAFGTGFRSEELSKLCPEHFDLDAAVPTAVLAIKSTKNKKGARQPLHPGVASQLRPYLRDPASRSGRAGSGDGTRRPRRCSGWTWKPPACRTPSITRTGRGSPTSTPCGTHS